MNEKTQFNQEDVTWNRNIGFTSKNGKMIPVLRRGICRVCRQQFTYKYAGRGRTRLYCDSCTSFPNLKQEIYDNREKTFGDSLLQQNDDWISLDHVRSDFYDKQRNVWIELKLGLKARFWIYTIKSKYFPNFYFNNEVDKQIEALLEVFVPLEVIVLDAVTGEFLTKRLFNEELN